MHRYLILLLSASPIGGSSQWIFHLNLVLSSASSCYSITAMSYLTASIYLLLGLPRFLFPGSSILSIIFPIYTSLNYLGLIRILHHHRHWPERSDQFVPIAWPSSHTGGVLVQLLHSCIGSLLPSSASPTCF